MRVSSGSFGRDLSPMRFARLGRLLIASTASMLTFCVLSPSLSTAAPVNRGALISGVAVVVHATGTEGTAQTTIQRHAGYARTSERVRPWSSRAQTARTSWTVVPVAGAASYTEMASVSCASSRVCEAVGARYGGSTTSRPYAASWNGTGWTSGYAPMPNGAAAAELTSLSCPTTSYCAAVGRSRGGDGAYAPLLEEWTSGAWHVGSLPAEEPPLPDVALSSISCSSATSCLVVGEEASNPFGLETFTALAYQWNGTQWSRITAAPGAGTQTNLESVSCSAPDACTAVGDAGASNASAIAERWDGSAWTAERPPAPTGFLKGHSSFLSGVSCPSRSLCVAVGGALLGGADGSFDALQGAWHGSSWTSQPKELLGPIGVSCVAEDCVAVGNTGAGGALDHEATAERLQGGHWAITHPAHADIESGLTGVSCFSRSHCFAVGWKTNRGPVSELIERYL